MVLTLPGLASNQQGAAAKTGRCRLVVFLSCAEQKHQGTQLVMGREMHAHMAATQMRAM